MAWLWVGQARPRKEKDFSEKIKEVLGGDSLFYLNGIADQISVYIYQISVYIYISIFYRMNYRMKKRQGKTFLNCYFTRYIGIINRELGEMAEWTKAADC